MDTASSLALLQEELQSNKKRSWGKSDGKEYKAGSRVFTTNESLKPSLKKDDPQGRL